MDHTEKIKFCDKIVDEVLKECVTLVCRMRLTKEPFSFTDSHLGGVPYLPHGGSIPMDENGKQLWLCAQINFTELPDLPFFPKTGMLQLFLSDWHIDGGFGIYSHEETEQINWRVVYYDTIDETVTEQEALSKMAVSWEGARQEKPGLWRTPDTPVKVSFHSVEQESVNHTDYRFDRMFDRVLKRYLPEANPEEYYPYRLRDQTIEERAILADIYEKIDNGGCKLGGFPRNEQEDLRCYEENNKGFDLLLLQLDDDTFTYPAGEIGDMDINLNGGTLQLLIGKEDLAKKDFTRVLCYWACS